MVSSAAGLTRRAPSLSEPPNRPQSYVLCRLSPVSPCRTDNRRHEVAPILCYVPLVAGRSPHPRQLNSTLVRRPIQVCVRQPSVETNRFPAVVEDALNAFLQPPASPEASSDKGSSEPAIGWRQAKIRAEAGAWCSLPPAVQCSYGNDFVAVHNGQVVAHNGNRSILYRRIRTHFGNVPVLITPASTSSPVSSKCLAHAWNERNEYQPLGTTATTSLTPDLRQHLDHQSVCAQRQTNRRRAVASLCGGLYEVAEKTIPSC